MSKHTPGPWTLGRLDGGEQYNVLDNSGQDGMDIVATVRFHDDTEGETRANARLIAAAPELLAALQAVVSVADRKTDEFDLARAAISKATGEQQ